MGFFADIKAISDVQKIKSGKIAELSISQITGLIVNMTEAKNNLSSEKFKEIYNLFLELRKCNTKIKMDQNAYIEMCLEIIQKFDVIAPYEKYSGSNEMEISFLMNDIRKENNNNFSKEELEYINIIVNSSNEMATEEDAQKFVKILRLFIYGKEKVLLEFDKFTKDVIQRNGAIKSTGTIPFFLGILNSNNIITENEMNQLSNKYQKELLDILMKEN